MAYVEARGASLKLKHSREADRELDNIRIKAHPEATPQKPCWVVAHFADERDKTPDREYEFDADHVPEMVAHILEHIGAPAPSDEEGR